MRNIRAYAQLCKIRISVFSAFSAATGFLLAAPLIRGTMLSVVPGVLLLACGACALNEYQERDIDARMTRTENRPIPSGRINAFRALAFSLTCMALGVITLLLTGHIPALLLGLFAVIWYNGVYTSLKKKTAFALIPGGLVGMIPPAMGWVSGGGLLSDPGLRTLCFFFFMWQIPHFWLLLLDHGEEYEKAGLPSLTRVFTKAQLSRIIFVWIAAAAVSCLLLPFSGVVRTPLVALLLFGSSFWLMTQAIRLFSVRERPCAVPFGRINAYMLFVLVLLSADRLLA